MQPDLEEFEHNRLPWLSWLLVLVSVGVYLAMLGDSGLRMDDLHHLFLRFGAAERVHVWSGEIWRLGSAMFLHANIAHLAFNALVLLQIGKILEPLSGRLNFLLLFFVSGVSAFCASLLLHDQLTLGSSGAVFGLVGALIAYAWFQKDNWSEKQLLKTLVFFAAGNLFLGLAFNWAFGPLIDNAAHFTGFLVGLLFGFALAVDTHLFVPRVLRLGMLPVCCALFFAGTILSIRPTFLPDYHLAMAEVALSKGETQESLVHLTELEHFADHKGEAALMMGRLLSEKEPEKAKEKLEEALHLLDDDLQKAFLKATDLALSYLDENDRLFAHEKANVMLCDLATSSEKAASAVVLNNCAWLFLMSRDTHIADPKKALGLAKLAFAADLHPEMSVYDTLAQAYARNGDMAEAKIILDRAAALSKNSRMRKELTAKKIQFDAETKKNGG